MSEILKNTGVKLWAESDYSELWLDVFDQIAGEGGKSNLRLIDEAICKINESIDGYSLEYSSEENRLYISKEDVKLPVSLIDSNGHVASKVDGTTITIDESGVVKGIPVDDALSEESTNPLQNKVIASELKSIKSKMGTDESIIKNNTKRIEANETAISTLNGNGDGSVKKAVSDGIAEVVAGAPEDFDTLKEMSDWIDSHENDASAMNSAIKDNKSAITALQTDKADKTEIPTVPTNVSEFINDAGYLTEHQDISNLVVKEEGKELSSNDYTSEEKDKLGGVGTSQGRNLIPCPSTNRTTNGITYTVQSDGSVLANGTASAENNAYYNFAYKTLKLDDTSYTLSCEGLPKSVYVYVYDETISKAVANVSDTPVTKTFVGDSTHTYSLSINVGKGTSVSDLAIKPILEMGTIAHAYEPISESNVNLKDAIDKVSTSQGKNIIPYPYSQTTKTVYGVTFTDNKDGSIGISGTQDGSTSRPYMGVGIWWGTDKKVGNIKIDANTYFTISSNCGSDNAGIRYYVYDESGSKLADNVVYGTETKTLKFDVDTWVALCIETAANSETYDCICKPQLELGAIAHSYEPTTISNTTLGKKLDSFKQYKPDGTTITADEDGTLHGADTIQVDGITITRDDATKVIALAKALQDKIGTIDNKVDQNYVVNNLTTTEQGFVLDGRQGKALQDQITNLNGSLNDVATQNDIKALNPSSSIKAYIASALGKSGIGWYRFAEITFENSVFSRGALCHYIEILIMQMYNSSAGCFHRINIYMKYSDSAKMTTIGQNITILKKVRAVRKDNIILLDIYSSQLYNDSYMLLNIPFGKSIISAQCIKPYLVSETSDGEVIVCSIDLANNI